MTESNATPEPSFCQQLDTADVPPMTLEEALLILDAVVVSAITYGQRHAIERDNR